MPSAVSSSTSRKLPSRSTIAATVTLGFHWIFPSFMRVFYRRTLAPQKRRGRAQALPPCKCVKLFFYFFALQSLWFLFFWSLQSTFAAAFFSAANAGATDTVANIAASAIAISLFMFSPLLDWISGPVVGPRLDCERRYISPCPGI